MNRRTAAPVVLTVSLVVLMSGCAGAVGQGGQVRDDLGPAANAAEVGLARGHVIVRDDLSQNQVVADRIERQIEQAVDTDTARFWSAQERRELHSQPVATRAEVGFSAAVMRELKGSAPGDVDDDLSPLSNGTRTAAPVPDRVDDNLSPLEAAH